MEILRTIVLIFAVLALLKGVWMLAFPSGAQQVAAWWLNIPAAVSRQLGVLFIVFGLLLIGWAVRQLQDSVIGAAIVIGAVIMVGGFLYLWPSAIRALGKPFQPEGSKWLMRGLGVLLLMLAGILFFVYF